METGTACVTTQCNLVLSYVLSQQVLSRLIFRWPLHFQFWCLEECHGNRQPPLHVWLCATYLSKHPKPQYYPPLLASMCMYETMHVCPHKHMTTQPCTVATNPVSIVSVPFNCIHWIYIFITWLITWLMQQTRTHLYLCLRIYRHRIWFTIPISCYHPDTITVARTTE